MTVREMQMAFDVLIQSIAQAMEVQDKPDSYTVIYFLNLAQQKYIRDNFINKATMVDNIENIQRRSDILRNLIKRYTGTASLTALAATEVDGGIAFSLPANYLYYLKSFSYATNTLANVSVKTWTPNRVVDHNELDRITTGVFNTPILRKPCVVFEEGNEMILYKDKDTSVFNISYVYLRNPMEMSLAATAVNNPVGYTNVCELDESTHMDIVEIAVQLFIADYKYKLAQA